MVNEAARCIEEGVVDSPELLDIAMIMGTGFPPFRGGLCRFIDMQGASKIVDQLTRFSETIGDRFTPSEGINEMARTNRQYYV
jgi:3-hydroxyacyl-CoA dehydrogenase/enoyl-CoA hydratase/3-hydroxybutyryl-CoA epimerase